MKKILLFAAIIITLASCKKEKIANTDNSIFGKWELTSVDGGLSPTRPVTTGVGNIYQFNRDSTYIRLENNKETGRGTFRIVINEVSRGYEFGMIYLTGPDYKDAWRFKPGQITIGTSAADGPSYNYSKIN